MLLLSAALTMVPNMWLWGFNAQRFLPAGLAWSLLSLWAVCLHPFAGRRLSFAIGQYGEAIRARRWARVGSALALGVVVYWLRDDTWFIGDFLIRRGGGAGTLGAANFEQSLPLEVFLYDRAPRLLAPLFPEFSTLHRLLGAASATVVALAAMSLARSIAKSGASTVVASATLAIGGYLLVATGLGKPAAVMCACTAVVATSMAGERVGWAEAAKTGAAVGLAILLHRSGLLLIPCWGWVLAEAIKQGPSGERPKAYSLLGACLPLLALAAMAAPLWHIVTSFDIPHHLLGQSLAGLGGRSTLYRESIRFLDLANLCYMLVPSVPLAAALIGSVGGVAHRWRTDARLRRLAMLALPWLAAMLAIRPQQGVFRDVDVFAAGGVALAAVVSFLVADGVDRPKLDPRLPAAVLVTAIMPTVLTLFLQHDPKAGLKRVSAYASEPPARDARELGWTWDFLTLRAFVLEDWDDAAAAAKRAVTYAPSPRLLMMQGISSVYVGDYEAAIGAYRQTLARDPELPEAWLGLAGAAIYRGDKSLADSAMARLKAARQSGSERYVLRELLRRYPAIVPTSDDARWKR